MVIQYWWCGIGATELQVSPWGEAMCVHIKFEFPVPWRKFEFFKFKRLKSSHYSHTHHFGLLTIPSCALLIISVAFRLTRPGNELYWVSCDTQAHKCGRAVGGTTNITLGRLVLQLAELLGYFWTLQSWDISSGWVSAVTLSYCRFLWRHGAEFSDLNLLRVCRIWIRLSLIPSMLLEWNHLSISFCF